MASDRLGRLARENLLDDAPCSVNSPTATPQRSVLRAGCLPLGGRLALFLSDTQGLRRTLLRERQP